METLKEWLTQQFKEDPQLYQTALASNLKVGQSTVSKWLHGQAIPVPKNCHKLARFFNVPREEVLIIAGHLQPRVIGNNTHIAEPSPTYHTGPQARLRLQARLIALLDHLTDDQVESLTTFLESIK